MIRLRRKRKERVPTNIPTRYCIGIAKGKMCIVCFVVEEIALIE
jgi:hypothetical protein